MKLSRTLTIRSSPHIGAANSVDTIMFNVVVALIPVCLFAMYRFGLAALLVLATAIASCVIAEHVICRLSRKTTTINDWSAVITGILFALVLPPSLPLWMVACGGLIAIGMGKALFGGLGYNPFNPALVGRAFLQAAFPAAMTTWPNLPGSTDRWLPSSTLALPLTKPVYDGVSAATPLSDWKFNQISTDPFDLFIGTVAGSTGETCALLILAGGLYLAARRMLDWRIPAAILITAGMFSGLLHAWDPDRHADPWMTLFSGGLMLGAVFMATDMVASPITHLGAVCYGIFIGAVVVVIRAWGAMPEGVMYAILMGNAVSPHIDRLIQPRVYGLTKAGTKK